MSLKALRRLSVAVLILAGGSLCVFAYWVVMQGPRSLHGMSMGFLKDHLVPQLALLGGVVVAIITQTRAHDSYFVFVLAMLALVAGPFLRWCVVYLFLPGSLAANASADFLLVADSVSSGTSSFGAAWLVRSLAEIASQTEENPPSSQ